MWSSQLRPWQQDISVPMISTTMLDRWNCPLTFVYSALSSAVAASQDAGANDAAVGMCTGVMAPLGGRMPAGSTDSLGGVFCLASLAYPFWLWHGCSSNLRWHRRRDDGHGRGRIQHPAPAQATHELPHLVGKGASTTFPLKQLKTRSHGERVVCAISQHLLSLLGSLTQVHQNLEDTGFGAGK